MLLQICSVAFYGYTLKVGVASRRRSQPGITEPHRWREALFFHVGRYWVQFRERRQAALTAVLGEFEKLRKATTSITFVIFVLLSACPSIRPHRKTRLPLDEFSRNLIFKHFWGNLWRRFNFRENLTVMTCTLHEDQYAFMIIAL